MQELHSDMRKFETSERYERYFWEIIFDGWQCHPWNHPTQEGSSFLADVQSVATVGDAQGTFEQTHFLLLSPSSGTLSSHRFIQGSIDARQIGLSNHVLWKRLLLEVQCTTQLPSFASNQHGAVLKPRWSEEYDGPLSGSKKYLVRRKHKLPSGRHFSCPAPTRFTILVLVRKYAIVSFPLKKLAMSKIDKCDNERLPSKNQEITEFIKSLSICDVAW